jgi:hypothetical protein
MRDCFLRAISPIKLPPPPAHRPRNSNVYRPLSEAAAAAAAAAVPAAAEASLTPLIRRESEKQHRLLRRSNENKDIFLRVGTNQRVGIQLQRTERANPGHNVESSSQRRMFPKRTVPWTSDVIDISGRSHHDCVCRSWSSSDSIDAQTNEESDSLVKAPIKVKFGELQMCRTQNKRL